MMRVLHLIDEPWDSGLTAYALQIAKLQASDGYEITVGVRRGKNPEAAAQKLGLQTASFGTTWEMIRLIRGAAWDLINAHTGHTHSVAVLARHRSPVIRTRGDARSIHVHPLQRWVFRRTAAVIAASEHIRLEYEKQLGFGEERLQTIYPSVLPATVRTPLPNGRIGMLGRLDPVKGHTVFLEAAAQTLKEFPEAKFLIAGKEAGVPVALLQNQARALGIEKSVEFLGYQPSAEAFMESCTMGVVASIDSEAISRACLEWMAVGRPVIGTLVGSLPELIETRETGLVVPPNDATAMAQGILKLLREPNIADKWGRSAYAVVQRRFSPAIQLQKTADVYRRAAASAGTGAPL